MRVIVINTGTELLLGDVLNTHLQFIAREILPLGVRIDEQRTVPDGDAIKSTLIESFPRADLIFVTGGLGPTSDDITRELVAEVMQLELKEDPAVRRAIRDRLALRRIPAPPPIWRQAMVPMGAQVLPNENGTAPGLYFSQNVNLAVQTPHLFLLPGPPRELQPMFRASVIPILKKIAGIKKDLQIRKFRIVGLGESLVERKIGPDLLTIPKLEVGYCARPNEVDLRVIGTAAAVERAADLINTKLAAEIFSETDEDLASVIVRLLANRGETLALAESCTGGLLAHQITNVPGASKVLRGGFVTYSNEEKNRVLGISSDLLRTNGAVSEQVAAAMAENTRQGAGATHAIATTGIAGPSGGSEEKPVGTVFIAVASANQPTVCEKLFFPTDRETFKQLVAQTAFDLLRKRLL